MTAHAIVTEAPTEDLTAWAEECFGLLRPGGHLVAFGGPAWYRVTVAAEDAGFEIRDSLAYLSAEGFAPIILARKPLIGTVAANVLAHGTGALNIDGTRVQYQSDSDKASARPQGAATSHVGALAGKSQAWTESSSEQTAPSTTAETTGTSASLTVESAPSVAGTPRTEFSPSQSDKGRWPANVVLDGDMADALDEQSGTRAAGRFPGVQNVGPGGGGTTMGGGWTGEVGPERNLDAGGASRFFPVHPSRDDLVRWLVRLVTPPGGTVLGTLADRVNVATPVADGAA